MISKRATSGNKNSLYLKPGKHRNLEKILYLDDRSIQVTTHNSQLTSLHTIFSAGIKARRNQTCRCCRDVAVQLQRCCAPVAANFNRGLENARLKGWVVIVCTYVNARFGMIDMIYSYDCRVNLPCRWHVATKLVSSLLSDHFDLSHVP